MTSIAFTPACSKGANAGSNSLSVMTRSTIGVSPNRRAASDAAATSGLLLGKLDL